MFSKQKIDPKTAFAKKLTPEQRQKEIEEASKSINEAKDAARKLVATEEFKYFSSAYKKARESIIDTFKTLDPKDHAGMIHAQLHLVVLDDLFSYEKYAEK
jgi:hypothetical protein